jgi:hypothetical protein
MLAKVVSGAICGVEAYPVEIEVNAGRGDTNIQQSKIFTRSSGERRGSNV